MYIVTEYAVLESIKTEVKVIDNYSFRVRSKATADVYTAVAARIQKNGEMQNTNIIIILTKFDINGKDLIFLWQNFSTTKPKPCNIPHITNVQFAPCHKPLNKKVTNKLR